MARLRRSTAKYVRSALLSQFRKVYLARLMEAVRNRVREGNGAWRTVTILWDVEPIRPGYEMAEAIPSPAPRGRKTELEQYEEELRKWKRARSIARTKVAKYSRLVRYHRKREATPQ